MKETRLNSDPPCISAVKAPYQDLCFLKTMRAYEKIDKNTSKAMLKKFTQHLWYLTEEVSVLSLFTMRLKTFTEEEQKQFLLRCVQEHRKIYPDCKKKTLKRKYIERR
ncbi:uncharacterized protein LOC135309960 [Plodia interpunctella]|uniref:uncharacterized protein LOC135309960 n=1 Tax=Plodia interpunctella TaxID=58824 RepID=UPI003101945C